MECPWFFCVELRYGSVIIAVLGILHPLAYVRAWRRWRSELFLAIYALVALWSFLSLLMFIGVLTRTPWLLGLWCVYSMLFVVLMMVLLGFVTAGFCVLEMKSYAIIPILGIVYYILTMYFVCVVHTHRKELTGTRVTRDLRHEYVQDPAEWPVVRQGKYKKPSDVAAAATARGGCVIPRHPRMGWYKPQLPPDAGKGRAVPGAVFYAMRLKLRCAHGYEPRYRDYVDCYSGGWNLPLPECVPEEDKPAGEIDEYYYDTGSRRCVARPPPDHGYYLQEAGQFEQTNYLSLVVACTPMHYLVGRPRVTCRDGIWDLPLPKCLFVDSDVCVVPRKPHMQHTCLGGELYAGAYRCDAGFAPPGSVMEPSCRTNFYVWGNFPYLKCRGSRWAPAELRNITCLSQVDIYRHYQQQYLNMILGSTNAPEDEEDYSDAPTEAAHTKAAHTEAAHTEAAHTEAAADTEAATGEEHAAASVAPAPALRDTSTADVNKTIIRISRSEGGAGAGAGAGADTGGACPPGDTSRSPTGGIDNYFTEINICKTCIVKGTKDERTNDNTTRESIWKTRSESRSGNLTDAGIWKPRGGGTGPSSGSRTTRINIWKSRNDTSEWNSTDKADTGISISKAAATSTKQSSRINIWKTQSVEPPRASIWKPRRRRARRPAAPAPQPYATRPR